MRLTAALVLPVLLLALIEAGLRVAGYGFPTRYFVSSGDGEFLTTNQKFAWQYYPRKTATTPPAVRFAKEKAPGTRRVFVLGESAAAGTPDPAFGFVRQLQLMLQHHYPDKPVEIINAAMRGIDSHIVRQIAAECATLSPDLFLIYMGNNDMIGLHAPSPEEFTWSRNIHWLRFQMAVNRLKISQLGQRVLASLSSPKEKPRQDQAFFRRQRVAFDDPLRAPNYRHYEQNLRAICDLATGAGAQALVCSMVANVRDFPPLASLHRKGLSAEELARWEKEYAEGVASETAGNFAGALFRYDSAAQLDDHFADLHFRRARCAEAQRNLDEARKFYALARDWDAMQFRADSRLNSLARTVATSRGARVHFADLEKRFAESPLATNGLTGSALIHEHVHFNFDGDHFAAQTLLPDVARVLNLSAPVHLPLSSRDCARRLAYTVADDYNVRSAIVRLLANPPFQDQIDHAARQAAAEAALQARVQRTSLPDFQAAELVYRQALAARPDDFLIRFNYANLLQQMQQKEMAAREFGQVVKFLPERVAYRIAYANALHAAGQGQLASEHRAAALRFDPQMEKLMPARTP